MWTEIDVTIRIDEVDASVMLVTVQTPAGAIEIMGVVTVRDDILVIDRAHVQGLAPGALSRAGLNTIGR